MNYVQKKTEFINYNFYKFFSIKFIFIFDMGRKKKYNTPEEIAEAKKRWAKNFYERNKDRLNKNSMEKYYEKRNNLQNDKYLE
jgi:hypothetical protein